VKTMGDHLLELEILGQTYRVRVHGTQEWAKSVGSMVDDTMREIQRSTHLTDTTKIAILAALNLADQLLLVKRANRDLEQRVLATTEEMNRVLSEALQ